MRRFGYILAEIITLYVLLCMLAAPLAYWGMPSRDAGQLALALCLVGFLPIAAIGATVGFDRDLVHGVYRPIRLLAMLLPGLHSMRRESGMALIGLRKPLRFRYESVGAPAAFDVLAALSAHLANLGIPHTNFGGLAVEDGEASWWLEASFGEGELSGWIAASARSRRQIETAIERFLVEQLGLQIR